MTPRLRLVRRAFAAALLLSGLLVGLLCAGASAHAGHGTVEILEVRGLISRPVADYLREAVETANRSAHVEVVVVELHSAGMLKADVAPLRDAILSSRVPVVMWVPPGGTAAGGALEVFRAAHVKALSLGAVLGPEQPVDLGRDEPRGEDRVLVVVPEGRDAAELRDWDERLTVVSVSEFDAVEEGHADFVVSSLPDVLRELDGRTVEVDLLGRQTLQVDPVTADVRFQNMGLGRRVLHAVASPALAYLLVIAGALALVFEIFQPGFGVSGISGIVLLLLGAYALTVLPVSPLGAALLVVGLVLLAVDLSLAGFGAVTAAGTVALAAGSVLLFDDPALRLSPWLVGFVVLSTVVFFVIVMTVVLRAQAGQAQEGAELVVGKRAVVRSMLNPEGHVFVDGALWRARAPEGSGKLKTGTVVRIVGLDDRLTLRVELDKAKADAETP